MHVLGKLKAGLSRSASSLSEGLAGIFTRKTLDTAALEQLEELLIMADMGTAMASELVAELARNKFGKEVSEHEVKEALAAHIARVLQPVAVPLAVSASHTPHVMMMIGVNGNGKTTTIGKLAARFQAEGHAVTLAAADTFRAAATEQLQVWATRTHAPLITGTAGADPASVAYQALEKARAAHASLLLIDTAGRLHNKANLMAELQKIIAVLQKLDATAPHAVVQVLDATTGQNALAQVETFRAAVGVTGLIVTKLDGTAKGGVVVALAKKFGLPIHAVGVGENAEDLDAFDATLFARSLVGLGEE